MTARTTRRTTAAKSRIAAVGAIAVAGTLLLTGCGDQTNSDTTKTAGRHQEHRPALRQAARGDPEGRRHQGRHGHRVRADGVQGQGGKIVGVDPDIAAALGKQLGVKFEFRTAPSTP